MRQSRLALAAACALAAGALAACASGPAASPGKRAVDAVVLDEAQRQEAAEAAQHGATASQALATVSDGPKDEAPVP